MDLKYRKPRLNLYACRFNPKVPRRLKIDLLHTFELPSVVCCVKFSADGQYLAAGGNKVTFIFAMSTGDRVA